MFKHVLPATLEPETTLVEDRRAAVRYSCELGSLCQEVKDTVEEQWPARIKDISTTGIAVIVNRSFRPGTQLGIELQSEDESIRYTLMTQIVRTDEQGSDFWLLGCEFARPLSEDEVQRLL